MLPENWFQAHRRQVAALLAQEANESTGSYLSYYDSDLVLLVLLGK